MKVFHFFAIESLLVVGLPNCRLPRGINKLGCNQSIREPFEPSRNSPPEIAPPMAKKVSGIEMTELAFHKWTTNGGRLPYSIKGDSNGRLDKRCQCSKMGAWKNFDSNDGTGDHEELK